jgi:hypothetical protein
LLDKVQLVRAVLEHLDEIGLGHDETLERLLLRDDGLGKLVERRLLRLVDAAGAVRCELILAPR